MKPLDEVIAWLEGLDADVQADKLKAIRASLPTAEQLQHLRRYVEWMGPVHSQICPADNTCNCEWKPTLDAVNALCNLEIP